MRLLSIFLMLVIVCCSFSTAMAGNVVDRVKKRGIVRCGGVARPRLAFPDSHGGWASLEVDVCRAVADAVFGSPDRIRFHSYSTSKDFDDLRKQKDNIYFLTGTEIEDQKIGGQCAAWSHRICGIGRADGVDRFGRPSCIRLAEDSICFMIGSPVEQSLNAYFEGDHKTFFYRAFSEDGEMVDTYKVQNCHALAGEITTLAAVRLDPGVSHISSHILPETLAVFPVIAATGPSDGQWAAIIG